MSSDETESLTNLTARRRHQDLDYESKIRKSSSCNLTSLEKTLLCILVLAFLFIIVLISGIFVLISSNQKGDNELLSPNFAGQSEEKILYEVTTLKSPQQAEDSNFIQYEDDQTESMEEYELLQELLSQKMTAKKNQVHSDFNRRYPRDQYRSSSSRRITYNLPRRLKLVSIEEPLTIEEKVNEIMYALDNDSDGAADPWEMNIWMVYLQDVVYRHALSDQWTSLGRNETLDTLTWSEYQSMVHPHGILTNKDKSRFKKDLRRWKNADSDSNNKLTKHEFKYFLYPQLSPESGKVLVPEAHADLDTDMDGKVDISEFLAVHEGEDITDEDMERERKYFRDVLDKDSDGYLDVEELVEWVEPTGFVQAKSEVVYLMQILDKDKNKVLSREEVLDNPKPFMKSQMTFFGQIYRLENLRTEVFEITSRL